MIITMIAAAILQRGEARLQDCRNFAKSCARRTNPQKSYPAGPVKTAHCSVIDAVMSSRPIPLHAHLSANSGLHPMPPLLSGVYGVEAALRSTCAATISFMLGWFFKPHGEIGRSVPEPAKQLCLGRICPCTWGRAASCPEARLRDPLCAWNVRDFAVTYLVVYSGFNEYIFRHAGNILDRSILAQSSMPSSTMLLTMGIN
jgi:hypothetical protein